MPHLKSVAKHNLALHHARIAQLEEQKEQQTEVVIGHLQHKFSILLRYLRMDEVESCKL
jgi:hypothetical protein